jgi:hypothetical protein
MLQVRASESLMKLISDIKQYLILNDFPSVNEAIADNSKRFLELEVRTETTLKPGPTKRLLYLACFLLPLFHNSKYFREKN